MKIEVRKPDGRVLEVLNIRPLQGFAYYQKDLHKIQKDDKGAFIIDDYIEPGDPVPPLDPELEAKLAWFVQNRDDIREATGVVAFDLGDGPIYGRS